MLLENHHLCKFEFSSTSLRLQQYLSQHGSPIQLKARQSSKHTYKRTKKHPHLLTVSRESNDVTLVFLCYSTVLDIGAAELPLIPLTVECLSVLEHPYPEPKTIYAVTQDGFDKWEPHWKNTPLSDSRVGKDKRMKLDLIDMGRFEYDVKEEECVILVDKDTREIFLIIIQGLYEKIYGKEIAAAILKYFDGLCIGHINNSSLMLVDDPGRMASAGYTAGQLGDPEFLWGKYLGGNNTHKLHVLGKALPTTCDSGELLQGSRRPWRS